LSYKKNLWTGEKMNKSLSLLIKPASGACNLRCKYCFYSDVINHRENQDYGMMKEDVAQEIVKKAFDYADTFVNFAFQGGEPTLRGLDFYREFVGFVKKYNKNNINVGFAIQTNGIVIDDEWAAFFAENNFLVGLSLDGYKEINDLNRVDAKGDGTFKTILNVSRILNKHNVEYNILCVVTKAVAKHGVKIYNFFKSNGFIYIQFIPCLDDFGEENGKRPFSLTAKDYGNFLINIFNLWYRDYLNDDYVSIRMFDNLVMMLKGYPPESCDMRGECAKGTIIEADGSLYPCDFYVVDEWKIGNVMNESFEELISNPQMDKFVQISRNINPECKTCEYYMLCRGGCKRHKEHSINDDVLSNIFCESYKMFYKHAYDKLVYVARMV